MSADGNKSNAATAPSVNNRALAGAQPAWRQLWLNLKVWAPYLSNRVDRDRMVRFNALDYRIGLKWTTALPKQCWECGAEAPLTATEFKRLLRAYENPLAILAGTAAGVLIVLLILLFAPLTGLVLLLLVVGIGVGLLKLKSWDEDVRLVIWSCPDHAAELTLPEMCVDDQQLCVFAPTPEIAEAAREAIREKRKRGLKPYEGAEAPPEEQPATARPRRSATAQTATIAPSPSPAAPVELPPIRLAGEEDDASAP
jgi:hypothetical protein